MDDMTFRTIATPLLEAYLEDLANDSMNLIDYDEAARLRKQVTLVGVALQRDVSEILSEITEWENDGDE